MKIKLFHNVPSTIFELGESLLLIGFGWLIGVKWHEVLSLPLVFMLVRSIIGKGKHYKHPSECLIWSLLVFGTSTILIKINYPLALLLTAVYAVAQTGLVDVQEMYMWKGGGYDYIEKFIEENEHTPALVTFENKLEKINRTAYLVYKYRFKEKCRFNEISDLVDRDERRISELLKALELCINLYFDIK